MDLLNLSQQLLKQAKNGAKTEHLLAEMKLVRDDQLATQLPNDTLKKAFWINLYNAYVLLIFKNNDGNITYTNKTVQIGKYWLSLDDIEHGILRRSKIKSSLGYLNKVGISEFELKNRVEQLDYRIHFALNCGANSCPPIYIFSAKHIESELESVSIDYLKQSICFFYEDTKVRVPRVCLWYFADFGGFKGILKMLYRFRLVAPDNRPKIAFLKYDWTVNTNNFAIQ